MKKYNTIALSPKQQKKMDKFLAEWGLEQSLLTDGQNRIITKYIKECSQQTKSYILILISAAAMVTIAVFRAIDTYHAIQSAIRDDIILYKVVTENHDQVIDLNTLKFMIAKHLGSVSFAAGFTVFAIALICFAAAAWLWTRQHKSAVDVLLTTIADNKLNN